MSNDRNPDFSKYEIIAHPCADRESRIFYRTEAYRAEPVGCDYRSHDFMLARDPSTRDFVILVQHGGGREALPIRRFYGTEDDWLTAIADERRLYAALHTLWQMAREAAREGQAEAAQHYAQAFAEGRLKKRRKNGRVSVVVEPRATAATEAA